MTVQLEAPRLLASRRARQRWVLVWVVLLDVCVLSVALLLALSFRGVLSDALVDNPPGPVAGRLALPMVLVSWMVSLGVLGGYDIRFLGMGSEEARRVLHASLLAVAITGVSCYLTHFPMARSYFLAAFVLGTPALLLGRKVLQVRLRAARAHGHLAQHVLIVGTPGHVDEIAAVLHREPWLGYSVLGALVPAWATDVRRTAGGTPVVGEADRIVELSRELKPDVLFFAGGAVSSASRLRQVAWDLEGEPIQVVLAPSVQDVSRERIQLRPVGGLPLIHLEKPRWHLALRSAKRVFDIVGATLILLLVSPLLLVAAVQIRLADRGPVLFRQTRVGKDGQAFGCVKLRTMVVDAEARLAELKEQHGFEGGLFKLDEDPRITRPGRWLRRFSVDELPQLVNVLRGEMSLVGPRPPLPSEVDRYDDMMHRRLQVRPGMTGLWQVSGRADLPFREAIRLDLYYVDNWSMVQDLVILGRTLFAVVGGRGAR